MKTTKIGTKGDDVGDVGAPRQWHRYRNHFAALGRRPASVVPSIYVAVVTVDAGFEVFRPRVAPLAGIYMNLVLNGRFPDL